jgi:hypothetical protein
MLFLIVEQGIPETIVAIEILRQLFPFAEGLLTSEDGHLELFAGLENHLSV